SMSSQWAKLSMISRRVSSSAPLRFSSVWSENTTPQPKVSSGRLRSYTVMSWVGSCFFIRIAKYRPAGPPPMQTIFMALSGLGLAGWRPRRCCAASERRDIGLAAAEDQRVDVVRALVGVHGLEVH